MKLDFTTVAVGLVALGLAFAGGAALFPSTSTPAAALPPLTYELPLKIAPPTMIRAGDNISILTKRCNNTDKPIAVDVTIFWQSADGLQLKPLQFRNDQVIINGSASGVIPIGCQTQFNLSAPFPTPADLTPGDWLLRGQVCYGDNGTGSGIQRTCTAWQTETFSVVR